MIDQIILRALTLFVIGLLPLGLALPLIDSIQHDMLENVIFVGALVWLIYLNQWCKRAYALRNEETISFLGAWSKARICLNTDILTKLAFLPVIGSLVESWYRLGSMNQSR